MSEQPTETVPVVEVPDGGVVPTRFENVPIHAVRNAEAGRWQLVADVGGIPIVIAERKLGGLDDDLQEKATPGFKEAKAVKYAQEAGRPRTEPGPGAL